MSLLTRAGVVVLAPATLCTAFLLMNPTAGSAALLELKPGPLDHPLHLLSADFNLDGFDDLAIANFQAGTVTVLINQKDGTFAPQKDSPNIVGAATLGSPTLGPVFLATGDLNPEDIDGDRVTNDVDTCPNVFNPIDATGSQPDCQPSVATLDSDGDGVLDYSGGALDNCPATPNPTQEPEIAAGLDNLCGTADDNYFLYGPDRLCGTADDKISKVGAACSRSSDLVIVNTSSGGGSSLGLVRVRVNDGTGGLVSRFSLQGSSGASQAVLADFNGDRRLDLMVSNSGTDALLYYPAADAGEMGSVCLGGSSAGRSCVIGTGECPGGACKVTQILLTAGICAGGMNNTQSCASTENCPGGTCRLSPNGPATCSGGSSIGKTCTKDGDCAGGGFCRSPAGPEGIAAGDFNGDGLPDVAFANRTARNAGILLNGGSAPFHPDTGSPFPVAEPPVFVLAGSLDGDACADLVVLEQGATNGVIQTFTAATCPGPMAPAQTIDLGAGHLPRGGVLVDFDGDGRLDLAVADFSGGQVLIFAGSGSGTFALAATLAGPANPSAVTALNYDPDNGQNIDLAVLGYSDNRVDLFRNISSPGSLSFILAPTSPVSPWKAIAGMAVFPADASVGQDLVLLNASPPRLDVLSGTGTTFRGLPPVPLSGPSVATGMAVADLRQDGALDLLVLGDGTPGNATPVLTSFAGVQTELPAVAAGNGPVAATVAPLTLHPDDYDQDGVLNDVDDCPTRYNPPGCPSNDKTGFPECFVEDLCQDSSKEPLGCTAPDPVTGQCDSDLNGVGDRCQILGTGCVSIDSDLDQKPDYDRFVTPPKLDNCPWTINTAQDDADSDGVGDACDSSVCDIGFFGSGVCHAGPQLNESCRSDLDCVAPVNDAVVVDGSGGALTFLSGDASGTLRPASFPPITGLANPVGAVVGRFSYTCTGGILSFPLICNSKPEPAILVAEKGSPGSGDDALKLFVAGGGGFSPPIPPVASQVALQGDPTRLLIAADQTVCENPWLAPNDTRYHFDNDGRTGVVAALEPGTSSLQIFLPSNEGPAVPPGHPGPLLVQSPPVDAAFVDLTQDQVEDLVVLSSGDGDPATPNITIYIGLRSGLFFTDPSFDPTDVPDGMSLFATGFVDLAVDSTYPDVVLFDSVNQAPLIMTNILPKRADIDRSGRVDGYDLALLARAFGAERGEDFTIAADGTLLQNPDLGSSPAFTPTRLVVGSGVLLDGMDLPAPSGTAGQFICDHALQPLTGLYGIPVDINVDGKVDGTDLALLASRFGRTLP